jgi:hypothetical protein
MDIPEPVWRNEFVGALAAALAESQAGTQGRAQLRLNALIQEHLVDHFDALVQAIVRKDWNEATAILRKRYPGSLERQQIIESALRGER